MAVTKTESDGQHPGSHYLVVEDATKPSTWHLRVRDANGKPDHRLMGAAWAALHGGYRGNKYQGPGKQEALAKLRRLYASEKLPLPVSGKSMIYQNASGELWFLGIYSNNYEDRHKEYISQAAHEEFIDWLGRTGAKPPIVVGHRPQFPGPIHMALQVAFNAGVYDAETYNKTYLKLYKSTALAQADLVMRVGGFTLVAGQVFEHKKDIARELAHSGINLGMSHGFISVDASDNIINRYRAFEFSLLPVDDAANMLTVSRFNGEFDKMDMKELTEQQRAILERAMDGDPETKLEALREISNILNLTLASKELEDEEQAAEEETTEDAPVTEDYEAIRKQLFADLNVEGLQATFATIKSVIDSQQATIANQDARIKELETRTQKTEDEIVAEQFDHIDWAKGFMPTEDAADDELDADLAELLKKNSLTGFENHKAESDNVIDIGFWGPAFGGQQ